METKNYEQMASLPSKWFENRVVPHSYRAFLLALVFETNYLTDTISSVLFCEFEIFPLLQA